MLKCCTFSELSSRCPFAFTLRGHLELSFGQMAQWLYRKYVRWFGIKSFPDTRTSTGYQYSNSLRMRCSFSSGMPQLLGYGVSLKKMKSHT